jgi:hypothetical protein
LISDVAQHLAALAVLDLPEDLTAELKVVTLLIDRVAAVAVDQNAFLNARDQIVERRATGAGLQRNVRHARKRDAAPTVGVIAAVGFLLARHRGEIACRLPVNEDAVFDQVPALSGHAFVVVTDGSETGGLCSIRDKVDEL